MDALVAQRSGGLIAGRVMKTAQDFINAGLLAAEDVSGFDAVADVYAVGLTPTLAELANVEEPADPILKQFRPDPRELDRRPEELSDPIGDKAHMPVPGIVHRHPDRVLLKATHVCPVYCRFCFRREMVGPGKEVALRPEQLDGALDYIRSQKDIFEVILTGGDPFMLSGDRVRDLTDRLEDIDHVRVIRWHTRMPVADPSRITMDYAEALAGCRCAVYVAVHVNHSQELSRAARQSLKRMNQAGISLLSQSVLLAGVNDDVTVLGNLMKDLVATGVRPYYLHHPDLAPGTSHFRVSLERGQALVQALRDQLTGLCTPLYVVDIPGGISKAIANPQDVVTENGATQLRGRDGNWHRYS